MPRPKKKNFSLRVDVDIAARVRKQAAREGISINKLGERIFLEGLKKRKA